METLLLNLAAQVGISYAQASQAVNLVDAGMAIASIIAALGTGGLGGIGIAAIKQMIMSKGKKAAIAW